MVVSGHRTGRFKEDLNKIKEFLNSNKYDTFLIPYREEVDKLGKRFIYKSFMQIQILLKLIMIENQKMVKKELKLFLLKILRVSKYF